MYIFVLQYFFLLYLFSFTSHIKSDYIYLTRTLNFFIQQHEFDVLSYFKFFLLFLLIECMMFAKLNSTAAKIKTK